MNHGPSSPGSDLQGRCVFVVGNSRSGTTMMGRMLGANPSVYTLGEMHFFEQLWTTADKDRHLSEPEAVGLVARLLDIQRRGYLRKGDPGPFVREAEEVVASARSGALTPAEAFKVFLSYEAARNDKTVPCDQTPRNVLYAKEILELYPGARVVNMVRDPRDVLLSQKRKWKRRFLGAKGIPLREALRSWVNYHPITISKLWNASVSAATGVAGEDRVRSLRFEDLLADPDRTVREICDFVGVPFNAGMLAVPQVGSSSGRDHPGQAGVDPDKAGNWRRGGLSLTEVFLCQRVTGRLMKSHGYAPVPVAPSPVRTIWSILSLPVKLALALLLNLGRVRNIRETIKRRLM